MPRSLDKTWHSGVEEKTIRKAAEIVSVSEALLFAPFRKPVPVRVRFGPTEHHSVGPGSCPLPDEKQLLICMTSSWAGGYGSGLLALSSFQRPTERRHLEANQERL